MKPGGWLHILYILHYSRQAKSVSLLLRFVRAEDLLLKPASTPRFRPVQPESAHAPASAVERGRLRSGPRVLLQRFRPQSPCQRDPPQAPFQVTKTVNQGKNGPSDRHTGSERGQKGVLSIGPRPPVVECTSALAAFVRARAAPQAVTRQPPRTHYSVNVTAQEV